MNARDVDNIATEWVVRLDQGELPAEQRAELERWLQADERHMGAFIRARAGWTLLDRARALPVTETEEPQRRWMRWLGAAAAAAVAVIGVWLGWQLIGQSETYQTAQHEVRRVVLSDGSVAQLDAESTVKVRMTAGRRSIELLRGVAWFDVAHDTSRPFVVHVDATTVAAVGTSFAVKRDAAGIDILVTNGVVRADIEGAANAPMRLPVGSRARVNSDGHVTLRKASLRELEQELSWREGVITVDGKTLLEAVEQFNRYNQRRLVVRGVRLAEVRIIGHFSMNDPESFARAVAPVVGGAVSVTPAEIVISELRAQEPRIAEQNRTR